MGVATIFYWNEQPPTLKGDETVEQLIIFKRMACSALQSFRETRDRSWTWPDGKKWLKFFMECDSRITYLKNPEPRGEYISYVDIN